MLHATMRLLPALLLLLFLAPSLSAQTREFRTERIVLDDNGDDGTRNTVTIDPVDLSANVTLMLPEPNGAMGTLLISNPVGGGGQTVSGGFTADQFLLPGGGNEITLVAPGGLAGDYTLTLPLDDGDAGEFLQTDGAGVLTWAAAGGSAWFEAGTTAPPDAITDDIYTGGGVAIGTAATASDAPSAGLHVRANGVGANSTADDIHIESINSATPNAGIEFRAAGVDAGDSRGAVGAGSTVGQITFSRWGNSSNAYFPQTRILTRTLPGNTDELVFQTSSTLDDALVIDAGQNVTISEGNLILDNDGTGTATQLRLTGTGTGYTAIAAGAQGATNITYTLPTAAPSTSGQVLSSTTGGVMSWVDAGLANFADSYDASSDVAELVPSGAATDISVGIFPKGTGAFQLDATGGGATGGNVRGVNAVDLQMARVVATQVAAGDYSVVGGGFANQASGPYTTVSGGDSNRATGTRATVGGGELNHASGAHAVVGGGDTNRATGNYSTIGGGWAHEATGSGTTIAGGRSNTSGSAYSTVAGGIRNAATGQSSSILGGADNTVSTQNSTIGGGTSNTMTVAAATNSVIGGGASNTIEEDRAVISGGGGNTVTSKYGTIGGGRGSTVSGLYGTVGGGFGNTASDTSTVVAGGQGNTASVDYATISGGLSNNASAIYATIGGGAQNTVSDTGSVVAGGRANVASGRYSTIAGGRGLTLSGDGSIGFLGDNLDPATTMTVAASNTAVFGNTDLWLANNNNAASELRFYEAESATGAFPGGTTNYTAFAAGAQTVDITYTLPTAAPSSNGQVLSSTTAGVMSWASAGLQNYTETYTVIAAGTSASAILTASGAETNINAVIEPKGNGAVQTSSTGDARGQNAVDLQTSRSSGTGRVASGDFATIGGGTDNSATASRATASGGGGNQATAQTSTVGGGDENTASGVNSTVSGGRQNTASGVQSTVSGGFSNESLSQNGTISGGSHNTVLIGASNSVISGGLDNETGGIYSTVGGGRKDTASGAQSTVGGGDKNHASGSWSTIGGGELNKVSGSYSVIPGGRGLTLSGAGSFGFSSTGTIEIAASNTAAFVNTDLWVASTSASGRELRLYGPYSGAGTAFPDGTTYTAFEAGTQAANITYTLPTTAPVAAATGSDLGSGYMETTNTGAMSWRQSTVSAATTLDFGSTAAQSSTDLTITVTGAEVGDIVNLGVDNAAVLGNSCFTAWVSADDTVTIRFNNYSAGALDPASGDFKVQVTK